MMKNMEALPLGSCGGSTCLSVWAKLADRLLAAGALSAIGYR
jgi:hypothetical protein